MSDSITHASSEVPGASLTSVTYNRIELLIAPKEIYWMSGIQFDFYDQELNVTRSARAAANHFKLTLERKRISRGMRFSGWG